MTRVKFNQKFGQRDFLKKVLKELNCPFLKELINRGIEVNYSTLKNYFSEKRLIKLDLFENLCLMSNLKKGNFDFTLFDENWGKSKGGKISKRK